MYRSLYLQNKQVLEGKYEELEDKLAENERVFQKNQLIRQKQKAL